MLAMSMVVAGVAARVEGAVAATTAAGIALKPDHGPPTTRIRVSGTGFGATEQVDITFDDRQVGTATTDGSGSFSKAIRVPRSARPGSHTVTATGESSGLTASATFLVRTDWPRFHRDRTSSGLNPYENVLHPRTVSGLKRAWSYRTAGQVTSSPAVANGVVYVGSDDHKLYALDAATGAFKWSFLTKNHVVSAPAVANGLVYVGSYDGKVYALNAATGARKWSYTTFGAVISSPAVADGLVYAGSHDGKVYAFGLP
jgi:outer membrane protein assembly factor BamB